MAGRRRSGSSPLMRWVLLVGILVGGYYLLADHNILKRPGATPARLGGSTIVTPGETVGGAIEGFAKKVGGG